MITLAGVTKRYQDKVAVDNLNLEIKSGEVVMLVGPSGCGKTTTLKMINRLIEPSEGVIAIDGVDTRSVGVTQLRRSIGYVIQQVGLFPHLTVAENVATVMKLNGWDRQRTRARTEELLELVGLPRRSTPSACPRSSAAASGSGSGWPGRWVWTPTCC